MADNLHVSSDAFPGSGEARVTLSPEEIMALGTTPVEIVPAPGLGKFIYPLICVFAARGTTFYTSTGSPTLSLLPALSFGLSNRSWFNAFGGTLLDIAGGEHGIEVGLSTAYMPIDMIEDQPLVVALDLRVAPDPFVGGDLTATVYVVYKILELP
jgi:hypothetical protein